MLHFSRETEPVGDIVGWMDGWINTYINTYIQTEWELTHEIMEARKSHDLLAQAGEAEVV